MSNQISEEAPDKKKDGTEGSPEQSSEKKIRQAVYDIRYRARREELDVRHAFSQYVGNSGLSQQERAAVKDKLFGKDGGGASDQAESLAIESVSNALFKVFESSEDTKYKIRVTDKEKGTSYVRYGDRKKITQLRSNPNISSVEMTGHGDPYEGDKSKKGEKTPNIKKSKGKNAEVKGKDHNIDLKKESYIVTEADKKGKKKKNKEERWQDSDGDGKWYEPGDDIKKEAYTVTAADKKGNTPAYQGYKAGKKNVKTGEPLYKAADHLNKEGYQRDPEQQEKERKTSKQSDPSKAGFTGISGSIATIMKQNAAMKKAATKKEDLDTAKDIVRTILEKDLNAKERRALPDKDFALPGKGEGPEGKQAGSYPIPDKSHARMALAMVAKHGSAKEKAEVRAAVEKKFPGIKVGD